MTDLYHGEYPVDMTPAEAKAELDRQEVKHSPRDMQRLNDAIEDRAASMTATTTDAAEARALLTRTMLIYCVIGDTHGETAGDQWLVGTFPTAEEASAAAAAEREAKPGCDATIYLGSIVVEPSQPVFLATAEAASGAGERRFKATGAELTDRLQTALFHSCGEITSEMASAIAANLSEQLRDGDEDWGLRLSLFPDDAASLPPATDPAIPDGITEREVSALRYLLNWDGTGKRVSSVMKTFTLDGDQRSYTKDALESLWSKLNATIPATGHAATEGEGA